MESQTTSEKLTKAFALCASAYVVALCAAIAAGYAVGERHPILIAFVADIAATLVIYGFSRTFRNASFYDAYWSLAPIAIALYWVLGAVSEDVVLARQIVVPSLVILWSIRLTYNWAKQWRGLGHEDWRYADRRAKWKGLFWLIELCGIEMMPTVIVFLGCLSLYPALSTGTNTFGPLDGLAIVVIASAVFIEATADYQLRRSAAKERKSGQIMNKGLWTYSRHPNYFGEIMFWWGLYIFALAADSSYWWTIVGPLSITVLFLVISIPIMDKRNLDRRPGYDEHMKKVSALIPWFPKK